MKTGAMASIILLFGTGVCHAVDCNTMVNTLLSEFTDDYTEQVSDKRLRGYKTALCQSHFASADSTRSHDLSLEGKYEDLKGSFFSGSKQSSKSGEALEACSSDSLDEMRSVDVLRKVKELSSSARDLVRDCMRADGLHLRAVLDPPHNFKVVGQWKNPLRNSAVKAKIRFQVPENTADCNMLDGLRGSKKYNKDGANHYEGEIEAIGDPQDLLNCDRKGFIQAFDVLMFSENVNLSENSVMRIPAQYLVQKDDILSAKLAFGQPQTVQLPPHPDTKYRLVLSFLTKGHQQFADRRGYLTLEVRINGGSPIAVPELSPCNSLEGTKCEWKLNEQLIVLDPATGDTSVSVFINTKDVKDWEPVHQPQLIVYKSPRRT